MSKAIEPTPASVRDAIGAPADTALIVADASDAGSLKEMIDQTKSVVTTVGPYLLYGNELLAACAASGTDYFDLCGETPWMRRMIDAHEATAQRDRRLGQQVRRKRVEERPIGGGRVVQVEEDVHPTLRDQVRHPALGGDHLVPMWLI